MSVRIDIPPADNAEELARRLADDRDLGRIPAMRVRGLVRNPLLGWALRMNPAENALLTAAEELHVAMNRDDHQYTVGPTGHHPAIDRLSNAITVAATESRFTR